MTYEHPTPSGLTLRFGHPEILLYHTDPRVSMSYPDLLEEGGLRYITETEKRVARVHPIDPDFLHTMIKATDTAVQVSEPLLWSAECGRIACELPDLPFLSADPLKRRVGYTLALSCETVKPGDCLFTSRGAHGGICVTIAEDGKAHVSLEEEMANCALRGSVALTDEQAHRLVIQMDVSASILMMLKDGVLDDGGEGICGWRYLNRAIQRIPGGVVTLGAAVTRARLYERCLMTAEAATLA